KVTKGLVNTLSTPDAYLNKMTLTLILIIISLLVYFLLKKTIKYYMTDFKKRMRIQTVIKSTFITITSILILFTWIHATHAIILLPLILLDTESILKSVIGLKSMKLLVMSLK